jgi:cytochrome c peroxidase
VVKNPVNIDPDLSQPLGLSTEEKNDLINFLKTLTDKRFVKVPF